MGEDFLLFSMFKLAVRWSSTLNDSLSQRLKSSLKESMKQKNKLKSNVIKSVLADIINDQKDGGKKSVVDLLNRGIKKRNQAIEQFGGRPDLIEIEQKEIEVLREFLPVQLSEDEVKVAVKEIVASMTGSKDMGSIMKAVGQKLDESKVTKQVLAKVVKQVLKEINAN